MTDSERWTKIHEIFTQALERAEEDRPAFIEQACVRDPELAEAVRGLLRADAASTGFLDTPVARVADVAEPSDVPEDNDFAPYRIVRPLGSGGMGEVFLAVHEGPDFRRYVAIKVMRGAADPDFARRFKRERTILSGLTHPGIARFLGGGTTSDGRPYYVMEHIEGERIDAFADRRLLSVRERVELIRQVCAAVQHAHSSLVVHRDLKPSNILVTPEGVPKLLDFGISKLLGEETPEPVTRTGFRVATPEYASPEQLRGDPVTTASDVYSLGVLLYEVLTGHRPHSGAEALARAVDGDPASPKVPSVAASGFGVRRLPEGDEETITPEDVSGRRRTDPGGLRKALRGDLDNILLRALRPRSDERYVSANALAEDLERYLTGQPVRARADSWGYRVGKLVRRNRAASVAGGALAITLLTGSTWVFAQNRRIQAQSVAIANERDVAEEVTNFLTSLFRSADPSVTIGKETSTGELLDQGAARLETEFADRPLLRSELLAVVGPIYLNLGDYERSRDLLQLAIDDRRRAVGEDAGTVALLNALGGVLNDMGDLGGAQEAFRASVLGARAIGDGYGEAVALGSLAWVERSLSGEVSDSIVALVERGVDIQRGLDTVPAELAQNLNILGVFERARGNVARTDTLYSEALDIALGHFGPGHPNTLPMMNNVAVLKQSLEEWDESARLLEEVRDGWLDIYGPDHYFVGNANRSLGTALANGGDVDAGVAAYMEALRAYRSVVDEDHPAIAATMQNIANQLIDKTDRYDEAARWALDAAAIRGRLYGTLDARLSESVEQAVHALNQAGRNAEAEVLSASRLAEIVRAPADQTDTGAVWEHRTRLSRERAKALVGMGRAAEARALLERHLQVLPSDPDYGAARGAVQEALGAIPS